MAEKLCELKKKGGIKLPSSIALSVAAGGSEVAQMYWQSEWGDLYKRLTITTRSGSPAYIKYKGNNISSGYTTTIIGFGYIEIKAGGSYTEVKVSFTEPKG